MQPTDAGGPELPARCFQLIAIHQASPNPSVKGRADVIPDLRDTILNTWRTNNRVTVFLIEHLPPGLWATAVPGAPRRTIRMIAGHLHNARCMWIKTLGQELGVPVPRSVDRRRVGRRELVPALQRSSQGILRLLTLGCRLTREMQPTGRRCPGLRPCASSLQDKAERRFVRAAG